MTDIKRGSTFSLLLLMPATMADGFFIGWTVKSQIRTSEDRLVAELGCEWAAPASTTRMLRLFAANTTTWPVGLHALDVDFTRTADGWTFPTESWPVRVLRDETQP